MRILVIALIAMVTNISLAEESAKKKADKLVNKHLIKTSKEQELQKQRAAIDARKKAKVIPLPPVPKTDPAASNGVILEQQPNAFSKEQKTEIYKPLNDPAANIQDEVSTEKQEYAETEAQKKQLIQKLKKEAEKAGYKVNVLDSRSGSE